MPEDTGTLLLLVVIQNVFFLVITVGVYWAGVFVARKLGRNTGYSLAPLGIARPRTGVLVGVGTGIAVGLGAFLISLAIGALSAFVFGKLGYSTENAAQESLMSGLQNWVAENPALAIPAAFFVISLMGPAVEELVFRGAIFGGLHRLGVFLSRKIAGRKTGADRQRVPLIGAAILSSALFALLHGALVIIPPIFVLALILCALYRLTGSLLPTFAAHATFNSIIVIVIVLSGLGVVSVPV